MSQAPLNLEQPSFAGAVHFAQKHMRDGGRSQPNKSDKLEMARLLWLVPVWDGGFLHGDDEQRAALADRIGLDADVVENIVLRSGTWPRGPNAEAPVVAGVAA